MATIMRHMRYGMAALLAAWAVQAAGPDPSAVYAWYTEASLQVQADGYTLASWSNVGTAGTNASLTASGRDLTRLVGGPQKLWLRRPEGSAASAVSLNGSQGLWAAQGVFGTLTGNRTLVFRARVIPASAQGFLFDSSSYTVGLSRAQVNSGQWQVSTYGGGANSAARAAGSVTVPAVTNAWQTHTFVFRAAGDTRSITHFIDGVPGTVAVPSVGGALGGLILGLNASAQAGLRVDLAEVLVFPVALEDAARAEVEAYLAARWTGVVEDPDAPPRPGSDFVRVFTGGVDGYACFRIPALLTTVRGTVIAVADGRIGGCGDIPTPMDLVGRRSFDNGQTWGPVQVIAGYGSDPADVDSYPFYNLTNISRVAAGDAALLLDRITGRVWVLYDNGGVKNGARKIKLELRHSDDDGATWSDAIDVEARNPGLRPATGEFLAGPGNGIQLVEGPQAGRLIFPVYIYGNPSSSMCLYSDDHGETWQRSATSGAGGGEVQMAETPGGGVLASMRDNDFPGSGVRTFNRSPDGGATWGTPYTSTAQQPALPDPACQASLYRLSSTNDSNASRLVHANAANASSRVNMTIRMSYDDGATWPVNHVIYAGGSAYSSVTRLANGDLGLLFEKDPYGNLDFVRRSVAQLTGGADSLPPYTVWSGKVFTPAQLADPGISGPEADPDGDGWANRREADAGTGPLDPASPLQVRIATAGDGGVVRFLARSNTTYAVQVATEPILGAWVDLAEVRPPESGAVEVPFTPDREHQYFRLRTPGP